MVKIKSSGDHVEICKVMRAELHKGVKEEVYMNCDTSQVCDALSCFVVELLKKADRPTITMLQQAAIATWGLELEAARIFGERIVRCISFCRLKNKSAKSCVELSKGVKATIMQLRRAKGGTPQSPLTKSLRKLKPRQSQESDSDCKVKASSSKATKEELLALYGITDADLENDSETEEHSLPFVADVLEVDSSQDAFLQETEQPKDSIRSAFSKHKQWLCCKDLVVKRLKADGSCQASNMTVGPDGFALAAFPGEDSFVTELPNLMLQVPNKAAVSMKRPAAVIMKKPASASAAAETMYTDAEAEDLVLELEGGNPPSTGGAAPLPLASDNEAGGKPKNFCFEATTWGKCKAEFYTQKSYIRHQSEDKKWKLVIQTSKTNHAQHLLKLVKLVQSGMCKSDLATERDVLQAEDVS